MLQNLFLIASKIKMLREARGLTQSQLARQLGLTRSSVNSWEMGLTVPSTNYIIELATFFGVSSDYLLGLDSTASILVAGLTDKQVSVLIELTECFKNSNEK